MKPALATDKLPARHSRSVRWLLGLGVVVLVAIGLVLLFLLTQATTNRELYERNYARLFAVNVVVAVLLLGVIGWIALRLIRRLVQKKFGSRLLVKLAAIFALAGFAPGMLIYVVSYQFVTRSIESWFDVKVEGALNAGLNLGRTTLDALSTDLAAKARTGAAQLADTPEFSAALPLERARVAVGADDLMLWGGS
ncbi:MAG: PAS domain-containing sensor histidine kinase, partial [Rhodoferax sp.]|nr:PAS domain-containing sensor histidine kinase [Rhodoferax sp.]